MCLFALTGTIVVNHVKLHKNLLKHISSLLVLSGLSICFCVKALCQVSNCLHRRHRVCNLSAATSCAVCEVFRDSIECRSSMFQNHLVPNSLHNPPTSPEMNFSCLQFKISYYVLCDPLFFSPVHGAHQQRTEPQQSWVRCGLLQCVPLWMSQSSVHC